MPREYKCKGAEKLSVNQTIPMTEAMAGALRASASDDGVPAAQRGRDIIAKQLKREKRIT